jgi:hypothetical protein
LHKSVKVNSILIAGFAEDGLMANSGLQVGQKIVSVNYIPCPSATIDAIRLIAKVSGTLRIEVAEVDWGADTPAQGSSMKIKPAAPPSEIAIATGNGDVDDAAATTKAAPVKRVPSIGKRVLPTPKVVKEARTKMPAAPPSEIATGNDDVDVKEGSTSDLRYSFNLWTQVPENTSDNDENDEQYATDWD